MIRKIREARENEGGFTLIELLVVVIIIGILAAIAIPVFLNQRESAWRSSVESDLRNVAVEMETQATENGGSYPTTLPAYSQSEGVTLTLAASSDATQYCITGVHGSISSGAGSSGTPIVYDSDDGGLADNTAGCA